MKKIITNSTAILAATMLLVPFTGCSDDGDAVPAKPAVSMPLEGSATPVAVSCEEILNGDFEHTFTLSLDAPTSVPLMGDIRIDESLIDS